METVSARYEGDVEETCPNCGRVLAVFHRDGSFDLAPLAGVMVAVAKGELRSQGRASGKPAPGSGTCFRWRCRWRRWRDRLRA